MIRIAIVEDEREYRETLKAYTERFGREENQEFQITLFEDGALLAESYKPVWDVILMDIKMKRMDGMKAAEKIRQADPEVLIIFITTMGQYAVKGYEVDALDFVLKPVTYGQFSSKLKKAVVMFQKKVEKCLFLPDSSGKERVSTAEILFIEVKNHNLYIVSERKTYVIRYSMQKMEKELEEYHFVRCNNSYLVNLKNVTGIQKDSVWTGNYELPISRPKKKQFLKAVSDYFGAGYR